MESLLFICFKSCLKDKEEDSLSLYSTLHIDKRCRLDDIKKAYKKLSLQLHPDKLLQRGLIVSDEHKAQLLKVNEAYSILSDNKRRQLYDELGMSGLQMIENPSEIKPIKLLKNFKHNNSDRLTLILMCVLLFACIVSLPTFVSMKLDGKFHGVSWVILCTPLWVFDALYLTLVIAINLSTLGVSKTSTSSGSSSSSVGSTGTSTADGHSNYSDSDQHDIESDSYADSDYTHAYTTPNSSSSSSGDMFKGRSMCTKVMNISIAVLLILTHLLLVIRFDRIINVNFFVVLLPFYLHELLLIAQYISSVCSTDVMKEIKNKYDKERIKKGRALQSNKNNAIRGKNSIYDEDADEQVLREMDIEEMKYENELFEAQVNRYQSIRNIQSCTLKIVLAIFIAGKVSHFFFFDWAVVFIPAYLYIALYIYHTARLLVWSNNIKRDVLATMDMGSDDDISESNEDMLEDISRMKLLHSKSLKVSSYCGYVTMVIPLLMFALIFAKVEFAHKLSSFYIVLPLFIVIGCCCCCVVMSITCIANLPVDEIEKAFSETAVVAATTTTTTTGSDDHDSVVGNSNLPIRKGSGKRSQHPLTSTPASPLLGRNSSYAEYNSSNNNVGID